MLSLLSQDLTALEGHYHKSFYREYIQKVENLSTFSNEFKSSSGSNLYKDTEFFCFFFFFSEEKNLHRFTHNYLQKIT